HTRWPRDWSSDVCSSDLIAFACDAIQRVPDMRRILSHAVPRLEIQRLPPAIEYQKIAFRKIVALRDGNGAGQTYCLRAWDRAKASYDVVHQVDLPRDG